jgi:hypothetical protein
MLAKSLLSQRQGAADGSLLVGLHALPWRGHRRFARFWPPVFCSEHSAYQAYQEQ